MTGKFEVRAYYFNCGNNSDLHRKYRKKKLTDIATDYSAIQLEDLQDCFLCFFKRRQDAFKYVERLGYTDLIKKIELFFPLK